MYLWPFVAVLLGVQALSLALTPASVSGQVRDGAGMVHAVVLGRELDPVSESIILRGAYLGGSVVIQESVVDGFFEGRLSDVDVAVERYASLPGALYVFADGSLVVTEVDWVGLEAELISFWLSLGVLIAFIGHMGCLILSWYIGDFLDVVNFGMR